MAHVSAARLLTRAVSPASDVEAFHQIETSLQVKAFVTETRKFLRQMIRTVNVSLKVVTDLDVISDMAYAWNVVKAYTPLMHDLIRKDPGIVLLLRATFIKLSSILSLPLVRITQVGSKDDVSVAEYHSSGLVQYVRDVLDIIPKSVFKCLDRIIHLQTHQLKTLPTKME